MKPAAPVTRHFMTGSRDQGSDGALAVHHRAPAFGLAQVLLDWKCFVIVLLLVGCGRQTPLDSDPKAPAGPAWFADVTEQVGLDFVHDAGPTDGRYFMPQIIGS